MTKKPALSLPLRWLCALALVVGLGFGSHAHAQDDFIAARARVALIELDVAEARRLLQGADPDRPAVAIERGRLALYETDYDQAVAILSRPELARSPVGAELLEVAQAGARATAGTVTFRDEERGIVVRLQDDADEPLVPWIFDVAAASREQLERDIGIDLPRPLRIELVRDQMALAAMTGLPERAARTTGTVAVAKWGRVTMLTPRAFPRGYPWADTLAHELAHLILTRASRDRAPLWLQEGVAKREESRWRKARPLDDFPPAYAIAKLGFEQDLARPIDKLGPSIAMLPSAEEARVAFAEVSSFIDFWIEQAGPEALPALLAQLKTATDPNDIDAAMQKVSGATLAEWNAQWMGWLATRKIDVPPQLQPGGRFPHASKVRRHSQLGELLQRRGHHGPAEKHFRKAHELAPNDASIRCGLAISLEALGQRNEAEPLVSRIEDVHAEIGTWYALHGRYARERGEDEIAKEAFDVGVLLDPLGEEVACEGEKGDAQPAEPRKEALCRAARATPRR